jgi:hypothetical protein
VDLWTRKDADFKAKSLQNKANRGKEGTYNQRNRDFYRYKEHKVYIWNNLLLFLVMFLFYAYHLFFALQVASNGGQDIPDFLVWKEAHKKKEVVAGTNPYYGTTTHDLEEYSSEFKRLHGEDSEPLPQPLDSTAVMISGTGKRHGCFRILDALVESSTTLTRVRATSTSDTLSMLPHPRRGGSTQTCGDVSFFSFLSSF